MLHVAFITLEDDQDLVVSFALAPHGQESLTLQRAPQYEHLLPEEERKATVSLSSQREVGDHVLAVLWQATRVEVHSEKHVRILDASAAEHEDKQQAIEVLRKMAKNGAFNVQVV